MGFSNWIAVGSFVTGLIQAWVVIPQLFHSKAAKGTKSSSYRAPPVFLSFLLAAGAIVTIAFGVGLWTHLLKPDTVTVYVDKPVVVPCPTTTQTNGDATVKGNGNAHSGNGDTYSQSPQDPNSKTQRK